MVVSCEMTCPSKLNSKDQSLVLLLSAAAYDALADEGPMDEAPEIEAGFGVATLVPSGVCATTLDPSVRRK